MPVFVHLYSYSGGAIMTVLSFVILSIINLLLFLIPTHNKIKGDENSLDY